MPKKKSKSGGNENENSLNAQRHLLNEPVTLHIMKEMDVLPLDSSLITGGVFEYVGSKRKMPLQAQSANKKQKESEFTTPEASPSFKTIRDDFVLFRNYSHLEPFEENNFSKLSDDIVLHIFHFLPKAVLVKCSQVCKRWKTLSYDESLWRRFDFGHKLVKPDVLSILLKRGVSVLRLAMSEIKSPIFTHLEFPNNQRFSCLQYLDLSMATVTAESLACLLSVCNILKKLSLEHCSLNEDCCRFIAQNRDLTVLNMAMCEGLTPYGVFVIAKNCSNLVEWNLAWTHLSTACMEAFLPLLPSTIKRFNISGHLESLNDKGFDDKALLTVVSRCPNLTELDISDCPSITGISFLKLLESCCKLQHLHTSGSYAIPTSCNYLLKNLPNFKRLEIFRTLKDEALAKLRQGLPNVKINQTVFSTIARPTTGIRRTSIWGLRVRD